MPNTLQTNKAKAAPGLSGVELEVVGLFASAVRVLGLPRSIGELYGLLFISPRPLSLDELVARLRISKGGASQGLKSLRGYGAVRQVYVGGDRRDHYEAETELKRLVAGFLHGQIQPHMETGSERLSRMEAAIAESDRALSEFERLRMNKLKQWHHRGKNLLPLISGMID